MKKIYLSFLMILSMGNIVAHGAENKAPLLKKPLSDAEAKQLLLVRDAYAISLMALNQGYEHAVDSGVKAGVGAGICAFSYAGLYFLHNRVQQSHNATGVINYLKRGALWGKSVSKYSALALGVAGVVQFFRANDAMSQYSFMIGILGAMGNYDGANKSSSLPEKK